MYFEYEILYSIHTVNFHFYEGRPELLFLADVVQTFSFTKHDSFSGFIPPASTINVRFYSCIINVRFISSCVCAAAAAGAVLITEPSSRSPACRLHTVRESRAPREGETLTLYITPDKSHAAVYPHPV